MKEIVAKKLGSRLSPLLDQIIDIADSNNQNIYLVGGFVRDILLNRENLDLDLVVEGDGVALAKKISSKLSGKITVHERFGTAIIKLEDGFKIDIASTRSETYNKSLPSSPSPQTVILLSSACSTLVIVAPNT